MTGALRSFVGLMSDSCCVAGRAPTDRSTLRLAPSCLTVITAPRIFFCECIQIEYYISYNNTSHRSEEIKKKILEDNTYEQNYVICWTLRMLQTFSCLKWFKLT